MKNCPYCGETMSGGYLFSSDVHAVFWLPMGAKLKGLLVSTKKVRENGGEVLDETNKHWFIAKKRIVTYYCRECKCFISFKKE